MLAVCKSVLFIASLRLILVTADQGFTGYRALPGSLGANPGEPIKFKFSREQDGNKRFNPSTGVFTATARGRQWYYFSFQYLAEFDTETRVSLYMNDKVYRWPKGTNGNGGCGAVSFGAKWQHASFSCVVKLTPGQTVSVRVMNGKLNEPPASWQRSYTIFSGFRLYTETYTARSVKV